jgi:ElaB/YqjD/DUF883 family membrane-anchored ribosome-binding protein
MNTNDQDLRNLLEKANNALEKAMIICDAVPSKAHENGVNEPLKHIGRLVNNGEDCFFYFRDIREAQKEVKEVLNYCDDDRKQTVEEVAAYYEDLIKTIQHYCFTSASDGYHMAQITRAVAQHNSGFDRLTHKNPLRTVGTGMSDVTIGKELKWAEGLILQLPINHDGRNSWLLNHGVGKQAQWLRDNREELRALTGDEHTEFVRKGLTEIHNQEAAQAVIEKASAS